RHLAWLRKHRPPALALWPGQVHTSESELQGMWSDSDNTVEQQDAADEVRASLSGARPSPLILVLGGHRSNGLRRLATITAVTAVLSAPTSANALEVDASVAGIMYFGCCSWSLRIAPDGTTTVTVSPAEHLSRRFPLSPAKMRELETLVRREDF